MSNVLENSTASKLIAGMYLNEELADVDFVVGFDGDVQRVPAHTLILASISPVFKAMFYGSLKEGKEVRIRDADADSFKEFLQFFYLGEVALNMGNIEAVVRLADKYDVLEYIKGSAAYIKSNLTIENMCWGYQLAVNLKNNELIEFCEEQIAVVPSKIFATDGFQQCDRKILQRILELDLTCKETRVFEACLAWAEIACKNDGLDASQAVNLRTQLGDCLWLIRFGTMAIDEFTTIENSYDGLFTPHEFRKIIHAITVEGYDSKIFNRNHRRFKWNKNDVLVCKRASGACDGKRAVRRSESLWFKSNQLLQLGEFHSARISSGDVYYIDNLNVTISEIRLDCSRKILYEDSLEEFDYEEGLKMVLRRPLTIKPHVMYEINCLASLKEERFYFLHHCKPTVELADGIKIEFHRNPSEKAYDTSTGGWIQSLSFNRL